MNRNEPWTGDQFDLHAADLAALVAELDLCDATHVGAWTSGCAVARPVRHHGTWCADPLGFINAA